MLDAGKAHHAAADRLQRCSSLAGAGRSGKRVLNVVAAAKRNLGCAHEPCAIREKFAALHPEALGDRPSGIEPDHASGAGLGIVTGDGVFEVQHRHIAGLLVAKNSALGGGVVFEAAVAIEMIGSDVERRRDVDAHRLHHLELKAGKLEDVPLIWPGGWYERSGGGADVAADLRGDASAVEEVADQGRRRGLAVGAGDADDRALQKLRRRLRRHRSRAPRRARLLQEREVRAARREKG